MKKYFRTHDFSVKIDPVIKEVTCTVRRRKQMEFTKLSNSNYHLVNKFDCKNSVINNFLKK